MKICPSCKEKNSNLSSKCQNCGESLINVKAEVGNDNIYNTETKKEKIFKYATYILIVVVVILLISNLVKSSRINNLQKEIEKLKIEINDTYEKNYKESKTEASTIQAEAQNQTATENLKLKRKNSSSKLYGFNDEIIYLPEWFQFGMQEGEIRTHYKKGPGSDGYIIYYTEYDLDGMQYSDDTDTMLFYGFTQDNKCKYVECMISNATSNSLLMFNCIKDDLSALYNAPLEDKEEWVNERYKNDKHMQETAIKNGDYVKTTIWQKDNYYIELKLNKNISVIYTTDKNELK